MFVIFAFCCLLLCTFSGFIDAGAAKGNLKFLLNDRRHIHAGESLRFEVKTPSEFTMFDLDDLNLYLWNTVLVKIHSIDQPKVYQSLRSEDRLTVELTVPLDLARFAGDKFRICFEDIERSKQIGCSRKLYMMPPKKQEKHLNPRSQPSEDRKEAEGKPEIAIVVNPFDDDSLASWSLR